MKPVMEPAGVLVGCCGLIDAGMGAGEASAVAERFKALSDPARVRILNLLLRNDELCVCDLVLAVGLSQPTVSHHLGLLRRAGLVDSEVRGRWAWYFARRDALDELRGLLEVGA